jgi:hypothetical protein
MEGLKTIVVGCHQGILATKYSTQQERSSQRFDVKIEVLR